MAVLYEVPLHMALVWIWLRDEAPVLKLYRDGDTQLQAFLASCSEPGTANSIDAMSQAWTQLREKIGDGVIEVRGVPFLKGSEAERIGEFDNRYDRERDVYPNSHPRIIGRKNAECLVVDFHPTELRLRPQNWLRAGGQWWREVETDWEDVLKQFGDGASEFSKPVFGSQSVAGIGPSTCREATETPVAMGRQIGPQPSPVSNDIHVPDEEHMCQQEKDLDRLAFAKMTKTRIIVVQAYRELRRSGKIFLNGDQRNQAIRVLLNPTVPGGGALPSKSTIERAFVDYRDATGLDLTRPDAF